MRQFFKAVLPRLLTPMRFCAPCPRAGGLIFLAISMLALHAGEALAAVCTPNTTNTPTSTILTLPNLTLPRNTPVGTVIYDSNWKYTGPVPAPLITCTAGAGWVTLGFMETLTAVAGMPNVYETGIQGIGIKAAWSNTTNTAYHPGNMDQVGTNGATWMVPSPPQGVVQTTSGAGTYTPAGFFRVQLYVTGPLPQSGGPFFPFPRSMDAQTKYPPNLLTNYVSIAGGGIQLTVRTCEVTNNAIVVELPSLPTTSLPSVGATAGATGFNLSVTCDSGVTVGYQIDGTTAPGTVASNGVLAIAGGAGQATGVGIQIQNSSAPVPLGSVVNSGLTATFTMSYL